MKSQAPSYDGFTPASDAASRVKRANRREGGKAEQLLRQAVWRRGIRFQKQVASLPGKPDLVLARARVCVFCDGDFWHGRHWSTLRQDLLRRANAEYWVPKITRNRERDACQTRQLQENGWAVLRLWETEVLKDPEAAAEQVAQVVARRLAASRRSDTLQLTECDGGLARLAGWE